jgi:hypothetical protein
MAAFGSVLATVSFAGKQTRYRNIPPKLHSSLGSLRPEKALSGWLAADMPLRMERFAKSRAEGFIVMAIAKEYRFLMQIHWFRMLWEISGQVAAQHWFVGNQLRRPLGH